MPTKGLAAAVGAVIALYPVLVFVGLTYFDVRVIALCLIGVGLLRLAAANLRGGRATAVTIGGAAAAAALGLAVAVHPSELLLKLYPALMNLVMLGIFGFSLLRPPSMIEMLARLREPDLPASAVAYTRRVTMAWCAFFVANGAMALWTALAADMATWTLYNGFVSYLLMGLMFAVEYLIRQRVRRRGLA